MYTPINPFPLPSAVSKEINDEIMDLIRHELATNKQISFFDMMAFLELAIEEKNYKKSQICAYYCVNVINNNNTMSEIDKHELINGIVRSVNDLIEERSDDE
jgi:hypothetical protein